MCHCETRICPDMENVSNPSACLSGVRNKWLVRVEIGIMTWKIRSQLVSLLDPHAQKREELPSKDHTAKPDLQTASNR
jgi:hypothetical protein